MKFIIPIILFSLFFTHCGNNENERQNDNTSHVSENQNNTTLKKVVKFTVKTKDVVEVGEIVQLKFELNAEADNFSSLDFKGINLISGPVTSSSSSFQYINGRASRIHTSYYTYSISFSKPGTYKIKPAQVIVDRVTYKTDTIIIKVISGKLKIENNNQDCSKMNKDVNVDYSYVNEAEGFSIPFNKDWSIIMENNKAVVVALTDKPQVAIFSIIKAQHKYKLPSSHNLTDKMINDLLIKAALNVTSKTISKIYIRNIKALQVEFDYVVNNMGTSQSMKGLIYMIEKGFFTYMFMLNCQPQMEMCYFPFIKKSMSNAYFEQEWYGKNN